MYIIFVYDMYIENGQVKNILKISELFYTVTLLLPGLSLGPKQPPGGGWPGAGAGGQVWHWLAVLPLVCVWSLRV